MKKLCATALSLALTASLAAPALAAERLDIMPISAPVTYGYSITVNGTALDTAALPFADSGYIPMRLVAESDHGGASWYEEEKLGSFYMEGLRIEVNFADSSVKLGDKALDDKAIVANGVTFLPLSVFDGIEGYSVKESDAKIDITTPNNSPLVQLAYAIAEGTGMGIGMKLAHQDLKENYNIPVEDFTELTAFFPMIVSADTLIVGKLGDKANLEAIKAAVEAYRQSQEDTFSWYLPQNLERVQKAQTVVKDGYFLFLIAEKADKGVELFNSFVAEQTK